MKRIISLLITILMISSIMSVASFAQVEESNITLDRAIVVNDYEAVLEFSGKIEFNYRGLNKNREDGPYISIRIVDATGKVNENLSYIGIIRYADASHTKLLFTLSCYSAMAEKIPPILDYATQYGCKAYMMVEERSDLEGTRGDGYIENVTAENTDKRLTGTMLVGDYDATGVELVKDFSYNFDASKVEDICTGRTHGTVSIETSKPIETETQKETDTETKTLDSETLDPTEDKKNESPKNSDTLLYVLITFVISASLVYVLISRKRVQR